ncbi:hypothetical protein ACIRYZ_36605 [Kitasatospora sp. NPDC101155]|uniref:hypothetical protein n=1 Tax=Kitasatospora sp. NPDC101155 TaxID=3364097 RepID=UPI00382DE187
MSGFARDTKYYGDRLVYEPLESKWSRYHATHCGCGQDWLEAHAIPAGFTVLPRGKTGYYGVVGPGLTEGVDESTLTTNALWEAVTGQPGTQTWYESVQVTCRSPEAEAARKAANDEYYGRIREESAKRKAAAKTESATPAQLKYLTSLVEQVGKERFDAEFAKAVKGTGIEPRRPRERAATASKRLTKATARKLISALVDGEGS